MREYFYPIDGRKHYKDLEEIQKDMFQACKNLNDEIFEKEWTAPLSLDTQLRVRQGWLSVSGTSIASYSTGGRYPKEACSRF